MIFTDKISKAYEQYCCVLGKNVVIQETAFKNGERTFSCTMIGKCKDCKNKILCSKIEKTTTAD